VSAKTGKTNHDILSIILMDLEELSVIHDHTDGFLDIIGFVRIVRDDCVQPFIHTKRIVSGHKGRVLHVVLRQVAKHFTN
jgi:hypothetical protein